MPAESALRIAESADAICSGAGADRRLAVASKGVAGFWNMISSESNVSVVSGLRLSATDIGRGSISVGWACGDGMDSGCMTSTPPAIEPGFTERENAPTERAHSSTIVMIYSLEYLKTAP